MNIVEGLAQVFGTLGAISMLCSNWQKTRKKMLFCLIFDGLFYFIQYILLKAYTGAFTNLISIARVITFNKKGSIMMFSMWLLYNIIVQAYISAVVEGILLIGTLISIIKFDFMNKKTEEIKLLKE